MKFDHFSDAELLDLYKSGKDEKWLGALLNRYSLLVFGVCIKYLRNHTDAEDATQQVFEKVLQEIPKYEIPYFKSWLYSVAKNYCLMQLRGKSTKPHVISEIPENIPGDPSSEKELMIREWLMEERLQMLKNSISALNKEQSLCIDLFYIQKLSYHEIEQKTGMSFKEVKSHIQNGKRNLKRLLEQNNSLS